MLTEIQRKRVIFYFSKPATQVTLIIKKEIEKCYLTMANSYLSQTRDVHFSTVFDNVEKNKRINRN